MTDAMQTLYRTDDPAEAAERLVDELTQVLERFEEQRLRPLLDELRGLGLEDHADGLLTDFRRGVALWSRALR